MVHDSTDLKNRTKTYALRIIKLFQALPKVEKHKYLVNKSCEAVLQSAHNIAKLVVPNPRLISLTKWKAVCRNWMKPAIGWNYLLKAILCQPNALLTFKKRMMN